MSPAAKQFRLLVGEEPQKNWVLWASYFNYRIQGYDQLLAMVTHLVLLIQHFLGILCATEFQATQISKILIPDYTGILIPLPTIFRKFPGKNFPATEIHGESHPVSTRIPVSH